MVVLDMKLIFFRQFISQIGERWTVKHICQRAHQNKAIETGAPHEWVADNQIQELHILI